MKEFVTRARLVGAAIWGFVRKRPRAAAAVAVALICSVLAWAVAYELKTSLWQSKYFSRIGRELSFTVGAGPSPAIRFPEYGPYDIRLGYTRIPGITKNLVEKNLVIESQARISPRLGSLMDRGVFSVYHTKTQAGLSIIDRRGESMYTVRRPERLYQSFEAIPEVLVRALLYIENREILDDRYPYRNPAVQWGRLARAVVDKVVQIFFSRHHVPGGSTIATQLEKYRHSPDGRTSSMQDKLKQMFSASLRAYLDGRNTVATRKKIVLNYVNSIPLAALPGYGEVAGLGDGLWAWYGVELSEVSKALAGDWQSSDTSDGDQSFHRRAALFKQALSLFVAHRRPSFFLLEGQEDLNALTNEYLNLLKEEKIISPEVSAAASQIRLEVRSSAAAPAPVSFIDRKGANAVRNRLLQILGIKQLYDLDQVDLTAVSTIDKKTHEAVTAVLSMLRDPKNTSRYGLRGEHTLGRGDPAKVVYSFTLYEHVKNYNILRVQADNYDRPFDINEGTRLDLGSTAKLRTLVTYLEVIEQLHGGLSGLDPKQRSSLLTAKADPLTRWAVQYLDANPKASLTQMLDASLEREYSANPGEQFFTGGGLHTFANYKKEDNGRVVTVREAIRNSINLPFIRLMRDIVRFYTAKLSGAIGEWRVRKGGAAAARSRQAYLAKFAEHEGSQFIRDFYVKYQGAVGPADVMARLLQGRKLTPKRFSAIHRYVYPQMTEADFAADMQSRFKDSKISSETLSSLFSSFAPGRYSLNDQAFLAKLHPLELWLASYLVKNSRAGLQAALDASKDERQEAYQWLFKLKDHRAQDSRIKMLIEQDAFLEIYQSWRKAGYPFRRMVPSLASAIGSSGDRPVALAELVGIILNGGLRFPQIRVEKLQFAQGTPFETTLVQAQHAGGVRVLSREVAQTAKKALVDVVENGTARRVRGVFIGVDKKPILVGGKTGTGDHRFKTFAKGGALLSSKVVSRTATFVFFIGDRFYGTVSAHVKGPEAENYDFTSALAAELLKILAPAIMPLVAEKESSGAAVEHS